MKAFYIFRTIFEFASSASSIFLTFYIFQHNHSAQDAIIYNLIYFLLIPVGSIIAGWICRKISWKVSYVIGILFLIIGVALVLISPVFMLENIWLLGLFEGVGAGMYFLTLNVLSQVMTNSDNRESFNGILNIIVNIVSLLSPLVSSFIVYRKGSYSLVFVLTLISFILSIFAVIFMNPEIKKGSYNLLGFTFKMLKYKEPRFVYESTFTMGVFGSLNMVFVPLVMLLLLKNIGSWGVINAGISLLSIIATYIYSRSVDKDNSKFPLVFVSYLFAVVGMFLGIYFNFFVFLIYSVINALMGVVLSVSYSSIIQDALDVHEEIRGDLVESWVFSEVVLGIGRAIILMILLKFNLYNFEDSTFNALFIFMTLIPFLIAMILSNLTSGFELLQGS